MGWDRSCLYFAAPRKGLWSVPSVQTNYIDDAWVDTWTQSILTHTHKQAYCMHIYAPQRAPRLLPHTHHPSPAVHTMSENRQAELHAASDPVRANMLNTADLDVEKKREEQFIENADNEYDETKVQRRDVEYDAQEDLSKRTGLRRMLRRNPSLEFIRELAAKDEEILEPKQVRAVGYTCQSEPDW